MLDTKLICMNQGYVDSISKAMKETKVSVVKVACPECGMCFKNDQELSLHRFRKHNVKNSLRSLIGGTVCVCCLKQFHTRYKILSHISQANKKCRAFYEKCVPPTPFEEQEQLDAQDTIARRKLRYEGRSNRFHPIPTLQCSGPKPRLILLY